MLEFNQWFFVLLANFLILFFVLRAILFKPLANVFTERDNTVNGALNEAKAMTTKREDTITRMNSELLSAKNKAKETFNLLREDGLTKQKEILTKTEAEAVEIIEKARRELQAETEKARAALKADIGRFSEEIADKLVKA
jgi:F-type H+-transporting ATPase subunit b